MYKRGVGGRRLENLGVPPILEIKSQSRLVPKETTLHDWSIPETDPVWVATPLGRQLLESKSIQ